MAVSTTFGYNASEDRIWLSCAAWPQRVWITRRMARVIVQAAVARLEAPEAGVDERPPRERAAAAHDASLNKPQPGERGLALQMGREAADAPALQGAVLCTQFTLTSVRDQSDLTFHTPAGQRRLHLSRVGLHRWLHALHMVLGNSGWTDWTPLPDWLTRSYLPPSLKNLLESPPSAAELGLDDEAGDDAMGSSGVPPMPRDL